MKNISSIHYYHEFGGNMGTKGSEILQGCQFLSADIAIASALLVRPLTKGGGGGGGGL